MDKRNLINSLKLAGLMTLAGLASCKYNTNNYYCPDCNPCGGKDKTETPAIEVRGDAIIINGDDNDATMIKGNNNNSANRSSGNQNSGSRPAKPKPKPVVKPVTPAPVVEPKPEPKPEPVPEPKPEPCKTVVKRTYRKITIEGDANSAVYVANQVLNGNCR